MSLGKTYNPFPCLDTIPLAFFTTWQSCANRFLNAKPHLKMFAVHSLNEIHVCLLRSFSLHIKSDLNEFRLFLSQNTASLSSAQSAHYRNWHHFILETWNRLTSTWRTHLIIVLLHPLRWMKTKQIVLDVDWWEAPSLNIYYPRI